MNFINSGSEKKKLQDFQWQLKWMVGNLIATLQNKKTTTTKI